MPGEIRQRAPQPGPERTSTAQESNSHALSLPVMTWWVPLAILVAVMGAVLILILTSGTGLTVGVLGLCSAAVLVGPLLFPLRRLDFHYRALRPFGWSVLTGVITGSALLAFLPAGQALSQIAFLSAGVAVLTFLLDRLTLLLSARSGRDNSGCGTLIIFALFVSAPVWLGPCAEVFASTQAFVDAVVRVSPLTYLAVLAEYDYLHSQWFYVHTPLAGLRFSYPDPLAATVAYTTLGGACWAIERFLTLRPTRQKSIREFVTQPKRGQRP